MDAYLTQAIADQDLDLRTAVEDMLNRLDVVRSSRAEVDVAVAGGLVTLTGVVQSPMMAAEVERAAAEVPGVTRVANLLVDDGTLIRQIAEALATDARTQAIPPGYQVSSIFGHVTLIGRFTPDESRAVMAVAQAVPGVRSVNVKTY